MLTNIAVAGLIALAVVQGVLGYSALALVVAVNGIVTAVYGAMVNDAREHEVATQTYVGRLQRFHGERSEERRPRVAYGVMFAFVFLLTYSTWIGWHLSVIGLREMLMLAVVIVLFELLLVDLAAFCSIEPLRKNRVSA